MIKILTIVYRTNTPSNCIYTSLTLTDYPLIYEQILFNLFPSIFTSLACQQSMDALVLPVLINDDEDRWQVIASK